MSNQNRYYPISVQSGIPHLSETPRGWKKEPLEKHLIEIKRPAEMVNDKQYQLITVKRSRGGVEERAKLFGKDIKVKSQFYVQTGDFLISKRQIVHGACGLVPNELNGALVSGEYSVLGTNGGMNIAYLKYLSESVYFQQTCFQSSIGVHVEKMVFKIDRWLKWDFNIPPLHEQKKIADILTTVDDKISSIDSQIKQTEQFKKGLMEKLLTEGIGHTEFKETEIGRIPKDWHVKPLGSIGEFLKGKGIAKKDLAEKGLPCVRYGEIYTVHHWIIKSFHSFISTEIASQSKEIKKNDVLFAGSGETVEEIGKAVAYLYDDKAYAGGDIIILRPENFDSAFISACLNTTSSNKQKRKLGQGNSVVHIYPTGLKQLIIPLPPLREQKQIATILSTVDDKLDILNQKKSRYQTLKKGLSQQLLTGQMRVKV